MKTAMIWGATGGIGNALLNQLYHETWKTIAIARDTNRVSNTATWTYEAEFNNPLTIEQAVSLAAQVTSEVDLWIYAAGDISLSKVRELETKIWERILNANLTGAYTALHYSMPLLKEDAHIMFLGAISERLQLPGLSAYAAAKSGLEAFANTLRKEERRKRVSIIRPGAVATSLWDKVQMQMPKNAASPQKVAEKILEAYKNGHQGQLDLV